MLMFFEGCPKLAYALDQVAPAECANYLKNSGYAAV
jgi:hypothetical protein